MRGGIFLWPRVLSFDNYKLVFENKFLLNSFKITLERVVIMMLAVPFLNGLYGYAIAKQDLIGRKFFSMLLIIPMYISGGIIPFFFIINSLGLYNKFWVFIIPYLYVPFNMLLFRSFFQEQSPSLRESAIIDGANEFQVYTRIIFPLSIPVFAAVALFTAVGNWNEWFVGQAFVNDSNLWPLPTIMLQILRTQDLQYAGMNMTDVVDSAVNRVTPESVRLAMIIIVTIPIMLVYPFLQKYFIHGIMIGAVKE
jgi:putative aldouronate transport system permease protein